MITLSQLKKIHFIGVAGIGMSAIAHILLKMGKDVSGSDLIQNQNVRDLIGEGLTFYKGHDQKNIHEDIDCVVLTSAVKDDNFELIKAKELGFLILKRAQILSLITNTKDTIAIAGSHGKTTTSCYLSEMLLNLNLNPSFIVGGILKKINRNARFASDVFVIEADESDSSFHYFKNNFSIITNIDNDHVDFYGSFEKLKEAFVTFMNSNNELNILNFDDEIVKSLSCDIDNYVAYGQDDTLAYSYSIKKMIFGNSIVELKSPNETFEFSTNVTGDYNINNLVAALIYLLIKKVNVIDIRNAVKHISGVKRRYDILYQSAEVVVIDDYAHHPTEIQKFISTVSNDYPGYRIKVFFEPHRFTRTQNFWHEFTTCFAKSTELILFPIYPASELAIKDITSERLFLDIKHDNKKYSKDLNAIPSLIDLNIKKQVIVSLGAGPISQTFRTFFNAPDI